MLRPPLGSPSPAAARARWSAITVASAVERVCRTWASCPSRAKFYEHGVTGDVLPLLTLDALREMAHEEDGVKDRHSELTKVRGLLQAEQAAPALQLIRRKPEQGASRKPKQVFVPVFMTLLIKKLVEVDETSIALVGTLIQRPLVYDLERLKRVGEAEETTRPFFQMRINEGEDDDANLVLRKTVPQFVDGAEAGEAYFASSSTFVAKMPLKLNSIISSHPFHVVSASTLLELTSSSSLSFQPKMQLNHVYVVWIYMALIVVLLYSFGMSKASHFARRQGDVRDCLLVMLWGNLVIPFTNFVRYALFVRLLEREPRAVANPMTFNGRVGEVSEVLSRDPEANTRLHLRLPKRAKAPRRPRSRPRRARRVSPNPALLHIPDDAHPNKRHFGLAYAQGDAAPWRFYTATKAITCGLPAFIMSHVPWAELLRISICGSGSTPWYRLPHQSVAILPTVARAVADEAAAVAGGFCSLRRVDSHRAEAKAEAPSGS
ncbi:hypothetical protein JL720_3147 [Aureococcus anophagefferens]|nr:hypothetical protein JL720_3147 [Aureococcus anophagefferens]